MSEERIGSWVVLRTLSEDILGPVWRLGKRGAQGPIEGLALGRAFVGSGLAQEGSSLREVLDHPFVARSLDLLEDAGRAVVVWEYTSGHTLRRILDRCAERNSPLGIELSLLLVERVAQGLSAAAEKRVEGKALVHGALRPELVWITNDGEVKILALEIGTALAHRLGSGPLAGPYLAPEVRHGARPDAASDVYALGALLFALVTGVDPSAHEPASQVGSAVTAEDATPLPPTLAELIASCLGPPERRPESTDAVHNALRELVLSSPRRVGPFELAYALHGLFGEDIAREAREVERGGLPEPMATPPKPAIAPTPAAPRTETSRAETYSAPTRERETSTGGPTRSRPLVAAGVAGGIAVLVALGWVLMGRASSTPAPPAGAAQPGATQVASAAPTAPTAAELEAQIGELVARRTEEVAAGLREQQLAEIRALEEQLARAQATPEPARGAPQETGPATGSSKSPPEPAPEPDPEPARRAAAPEPSPAQAQMAPEASVSASNRESAPAQLPPAATATPSRPEPVDANPATQASVPEAVPQRMAPPPATRVGDLVTAGPGVTPPSMARFVRPDYPLLARRTKVQGTVVLSVLVDETGKAIEVKFLKRVEQDVGLNEAAQEAARASTWKPAMKDGVPVKMWSTLPVPFALE